MCQWPWLLVVGTLQVMVIDEQALSELDAEQLREVTQRLLTELRHQRALNEKLTYPDGHPNSPAYGHLKLPHLN